MSHENEKKRRDNQAKIVLVALGATTLAAGAAFIGWIFGRQHEQTLTESENLRRSVRKAERARRTLTDDGCEPAGDDTTGVCIICMENVANILFNPCGHLCACPACARTMSGSGESFPCPACRKPVTEVQRIFLQGA